MRVIGSGSSFDNIYLTNTVGKELLAETVSAAESKTEANYTPETWGPFAEALENAKTVLRNENATQFQVDEATGDLTEKMNALIEKEGTSSQPEDSSSSPGASTEPEDPSSKPDTVSSEKTADSSGTENSNNAQTGDGMTLLVIGIAVLALISAGLTVVLRKRRFG